MPEFSFIIPLFNRADEIEELIQSFINISEKDSFEVIIVEDGSDKPAGHVIKKYNSSLNLRYYTKDNTGPGPSRNFGAQKAKGHWLIFIDSDCLVPPTYLEAVKKQIFKAKHDAFGGPDKAHSSFTKVQKAINYSMTSFLTTGGIRGGENQLEHFKPRSFNMGIKAAVFEKIGGFNNMRFGEDIDLSIRLESEQYQSALIPDAFVYHKRRSTFSQFYKQVFNSGVARVYLSSLHPGSLRAVHILPSLFVGFLVSTILLFPVFWQILLPIGLIVLSIFIDSSLKNRSPVIGLLSVISSLIQLIGYGMGFLHAAIRVYILRKQPRFGFEKTFYGASSGNSSN